jgi:hypothetical protein
MVDNIVGLGHGTVPERAPERNGHTVLSKFNKLSAEDKGLYVVVNQNKAFKGLPDYLKFGFFAYRRDPDFAECTATEVLQFYVGLKTLQIRADLVTAR